ncbi:MAG: deoxyguanosinetriphosphate triphosphohydrolase [Spartobacteria bacterium]|nr:deoxyguanosinetriphosphate triphosphohydrolase [Spartobacteria bacterium]
MNMKDEVVAPAPFAAHSERSRGRLFDEAQHPYRSDFQRDRDRVLHCRAFRRLEYKTQVFVNGTADHYRTRLTHTMEMAAVGRTIARALRVNEDLTEAIALAHDIGHSPFGHCGERALDELMKNEGGFDHNIQSLRWAEVLEECYPAFNGLNLTWEVRAGLRKHLAHVPGADLDGQAIGPWQYAEAQIADVADDMAYYAHDIDDGVDAGLISPDQLAPLDLWQQAIERTAHRYGEVPERRATACHIRSLLDLLVEDVITASLRCLKQYAPHSPADIMNAPERMIAFSPETADRLAPLRAFLFKEVYWHPAVDSANKEAVEMMQRLFLHYVEHPDHMGRKARGRIEQHGLWRTACDYVSGCTDRYAMEEYQRFGLAG